MPPGWYVTAPLEVIPTAGIIANRVRSKVRGRKDSKPKDRAIVKENR